MLPSPKSQSKLAIEPSGSKDSDAEKATFNGFCPKSVLAFMTAIGLRLMPESITSIFLSLEFVAPLLSVTVSLTLNSPALLNV